MTKNRLYTLGALFFGTIIIISQIYQQNPLSQPPTFLIPILIFYFFLLIPQFYIFVAAAIVYAYFAKNLDGLKQHVIGGGITGLASMILSGTLIQVGRLVDQRFVYDYSASTSSYAVGQTTVWQNPGSFLEILGTFLISSAVVVILGSSIATFSYVAWPKIKQNFLRPSSV
ncbi:MAG: hypothetical protein AB8G95_19815 [Anaerolineae bacterium]